MKIIERYLSQHPILSVVAPLSLLSIGLFIATSWQFALMISLIIAVTALAVGVLCYRQKQRMRARLVADIRSTLTDVIQNELTALALYMAIVERKPERMGELLDIYQSMRQHISGAIDSLSADSLQQWKERYGRSGFADG